jgi:hypothetical protein
MRGDAGMLSSNCDCLSGTGIVGLLQTVGLFIAAKLKGLSARSYARIRLNVQ